MRSALCVAAVVLAGAFATGDDRPAVQEIPTKGLKVAFVEGGKPTEPTVIASAEELAKSAALKGAAEAVGKQVDFAKQKLVFFSWGGSGGDRIAPDEMAPGTFRLTRGLTRDFRMHARLFAVPKDAAVKVVTAK